LCPTAAGATVVSRSQGEAKWKIEGESPAVAEAV
jgi:hypothetical protein